MELQSDKGSRRSWVQCNVRPAGLLYMHELVLRHFLELNPPLVQTTMDR